MKRFVYLDNAATTRLSERAFEAALPYMEESYGNPSSIYSIGQDARKAVETARNDVADIVGAAPEEIFFTSGGTESDNWAIMSAASMKQNKSGHIITTKIEHPAVLNTVKYLEINGCRVTYLSTDKNGQISLDELKDSVCEDTSLISIMTANNEIGTILPISQIGEVARKHDIPFHTDAVQAVGHIPINVKTLNTDMLSFSGHKFGGMKGVGVLYVRKGLKLPPFMHGGHQEQGKRPGTENVAGIVALAAALKQQAGLLPATDIAVKRDRLIAELLRIPKSRLTGDPANRLPGIASFVFEAIEGESMLLMLNRCGICASSGSACTSGSLDPSHVLLSIGLPHEIAHGSLRLSLSHDTTDEDIDYVLNNLPQIVEKLRSMSPVWKE